MSTSAPRARLVDALSGAKAPEKFFEALSEATNFCAELNELHELRTRNEELAAENERLADDLVCARESLAVWRDRALAKRDDSEAQL